MAGNCGEFTAELLKVYDGVVDAEKSLIGLHRRIRMLLSGIWTSKENWAGPSKVPINRLFPLSTMTSMKI